MAKRSDVTKAAKKELSQNVKGRPNKYTNWYGVNDNWCAMFVSYVMNKASVPASVVPKTAAVQTLYDFAKKNRRFKAKNSGYEPKGGDIMIQKSNGASHTGIVISSSGTTFNTIEGNSGNAVRQCSYNLSSANLTGFFVPDYSENNSGFSEDTEGTKNETVELCSTSIVSTVNVNGNAEARKYINVQGLNAKYELHIVNNGIDYVPLVVGGVKWTTEWCDTVGQLDFTILKDNNLNITEGNVVIFKSGGVGVFYGYLFEKSKGKDGNIKCRAFDQLRYFKNTDTYIYKSRKYSDLLKLIANDYLLTCGDISDTKYVIPCRVEDNKSLFEITKNARKLTLYGCGKLYILYDDFGELALKSIEELKTGYWLTEKTAEDFDYKTSIDDGVYNKIQFYRDDDTTGNRAKYIYQDGESVSKWGVLQTTIKLEDGDNPELYGKYLLNAYKQKKRTLTVKNCFGDVKLRAGASFYLSLNVGDVIYDKALFFITKAIHNFDKHHTCDLTVAGQENFVGEVS